MRGNNIKHNTRENKFLNIIKMKKKSIIVRFESFFSPSYQVEKKNYHFKSRKEQNLVLSLFNQKKKRKRKKTYWIYFLYQNSMQENSF